ncbi:F-box only protein 30-like isoform X1 [Lampetra fluviatilis]
MRRRSGASPPPPSAHAHCLSCVSSRCRATPEARVCCAQVGCPCACGARYHACKGDEHALLCPLERVPCINRDFGCPFSMQRCRLGQHLQTCPASVVCCSMEWNRWPISYTDRKLFEQLCRHGDPDKQLDLAVAQRDQRLLLQTLQGARLFPELMAEPPIMPCPTADAACPTSPAGSKGHLEKDLQDLYRATMETTKCLEAALDLLNNGTDRATGGRGCPASRDTEDTGDTDEVVRAIVDTFDAALFSKERSQQRATAKAEASVAGSASTMGGPTEDGPVLPPPHNGVTGPDGGAAALLPLAGGSDGTDSTSCQSQQGSMLIHFGQRAACTPREQDFVYGSLEPQAITTVSTFKVPTSFRGYKSRLGDALQFRRSREDRAVDTSDLDSGVDEEAEHSSLGRMDVLTAAFMYCLEGEARPGTGISDMRSTGDGYHVDVGTQTFVFPTLLASKDFLANLASDTGFLRKEELAVAPLPQVLALDLVQDCVTMYHTKQRSVFTFVCGQSFRRDEFSWHFRNSHGDVHSALNGWLEQRCPLAHYGCSHSQRRLCPVAQGYRLVHSAEMGALGVSMSQPSPSPSGDANGSADQLSALPFEIVRRVAAMLDGFSLCQLALVSRTMRDVCSSLLHERGMVALVWERTRGPDGRAFWSTKAKAWSFSTAFEPVRHWAFADTPSMSEHLRHCPCYTVEVRTDAVPLPCMGGPREHARRALRRSLRPTV